MSRSSNPRPSKIKLADGLQQSAVLVRNGLPPAGLPRAALLLAIFLLLTACESLPTALPAFPTLPQPSPAAPETEVVVTFRVALPEALPPGEQIYLNAVDELTGLPFNPTPFVMTGEDSRNFVLIQPLPLGRIFTYRYSRKGDYTAQELTADGRPVRYRILHATDPMIVQDIVSRWTDSQPTASLGRIVGQALEIETGQPIPNLLVTAGGQQTWTAADGTFRLEGLPEGTHHLVLFAADGSYHTFQQGATVAAGAATPASVQLTPSTWVTVTFTVTPPEDTPEMVEVRLLGSLSQLGNAYASLRGGVSNTAVRLPVMQRQANGQFSLTVSLPAGADIAYKYTLGDGIWNAEQDTDGRFVVRRISVPGQDAQIRDTITRWSDTDRQAMIFQVSTPDNTPADEAVAIQFNPGYAWLEPLPMWNLGGNNWGYILYSPLRGLESLQYRYCRAGQCGSGDDRGTSGSLAAGRTANLSEGPFKLNDIVAEWAWLSTPLQAAVVPNLEIPVRGEGFLTGVALQTGYHPSWFYRMPAAVDDIASLNSNWAILQPSWSYTRGAPPVLEAVPGSDLSGADLNGMITYIRSKAMGVGLYPQVQYPKDANVWWAEQPRDFPWWVSWFNAYQDFLNHHADVAARAGAAALILGEPSLSPALPGGEIADGSPSGTPEDTEVRWRAMIQGLRERYTGGVYWALRYPQDVQNQPAFLDAVDALYIVWSAPLSQDPAASEATLAGEAGRLLDEQLLPLQQRFNKPLVLAIAYPSVTGGVTGCLPGLEGGCLEFGLLAPPNPDIAALSLDLAEQERAYNAIFLAVKDRPWIAGVVSDGYYPPISLQDKSISIHGKPARGVVWFWFGRFLGK
jgi:hypothetical protein